MKQRLLGPFLRVKPQEERQGEAASSTSQEPVLVAHEDDEESAESTSQTQEVPKGASSGEPQL